MDDNTAWVLSWLLIVIVLLGIGFMVYYENVNQSELEQCQEDCSILTGNTERLNCLLYCNERLAQCKEFVSQGLGENDE